MRTRPIFFAIVLALVLTVAGCSLDKQRDSGRQQEEVKAQAVVYLKGYVQRPGTYFVAPRTELGEVIKLAGGLLPEADAAKVDLQAPVIGVMEINIPGLQETSVPAAGRSETAPPLPNYAPLSPAPVDPRPAVKPAPPVAVYRIGTVMSAQEQQLVDLVNRERSSRGIAPLTVDGQLTRVARLKSQDMVDNNYFAHESPKYGTPSAMISNQGITYHYVGENIAIDGSVESAHKNLMGSPGHRQGILNNKFAHVGIGIVQGPYGLVITQHFTD